SYTQQYANIYFLRLTLLRPRVEEAARRKWKDYQPNGPRTKLSMSRVLDIQTDQTTWIVGTIFADMSLKPNVLHDLQSEMNLSKPHTQPFYYHEGDDVYIEDESGRVKLWGKLPQSDMVTGIVLAVLGKANDDGEFIVEEICRPGAPPNPTPEVVSKDNGKGKSLALLSGLAFGSPASCGLHYQLLEEYLQGDLGSREDQTACTSMVRLMIAGNSVDASSSTSTPNPPSGDKSYGLKRQKFNAKPTHLLDNFLMSVSSSMPIDILPGETDPAVYALPQPPLHHVLLPQASLTSTVHRRINPHWSEVEGRCILTMSGRSLDDLCRYSLAEDKMDEKDKNLLEWNHLTPTAPDTLTCFPFQDREPFFLDRLPHILIIGNQPEFATTLYHGQGSDVCRIILLPKFADTGILVSVELSTLDVTIRCF
ncbi:MAG: DNA polymerase alpha/epsilon subunit B-domain-containing protein, partial [Piptocephalis tieghemiana]